MIQGGVLQKEKIHGPEKKKKEKKKSKIKDKTKQEFLSN